jgi:hypothetical protein
VIDNRGKCIAKEDSADAPHDCESLSSHGAVAALPWRSIKVCKAASITSRRRWRSRLTSV